MSRPLNKKLTIVLIEVCFEVIIDSSDTRTAARQALLLVKDPVVGIDQFLLCGPINYVSMLLE